MQHWSKAEISVLLLFNVFLPDTFFILNQFYGLRQTDGSNKIITKDKMENLTCDSNMDKIQITDGKHFGWAKIMSIVSEVEPIDNRF